MEPFTILCATCQSRIRVRNPRMIGQIAKCPKCDSMVMVAAPGRIEVESRGDQPVDSMALTKDGIGTELPLAPTTPHASADDGQVASPADQHSTDTHDGELRLVAEEDPPESRTGAPPVEAFDDSENAGWQSAAPPLMPSEQWTSPNATKTRMYLLIGFLGASGVVLASVLFFAFLRWYSSPKPDLNASGVNASDPQFPNADAAQPVTDAGSSIESEGGSPDSSAADDPNPPTSLASGTDSTENPSTLPIGMDSLDAPSEPDQSLASETPADAASDTVDVDSQLQLGGENNALEQADATGVAASEGNGALASADASANQENAVPAALPKQLEAFGEMLDWQVQPQLPDAVTVLAEAPVTAEDLGLASTEQSLQLPPIDWSTHSQTTLPGLVIAPQPLAQFVSLWSNISGVPTTVDLDSLAAANIDRNSKLELGMVRSSTIIEIAQRMGQPLGLMVRPSDNRYLTLGAPQDAIKQILPASVSVQGLLRNDSDHQWLTESLTQLFPVVAVSDWIVADEELRAPPSLDAATWFEVLRLIGSWRIAAGLPTGLAGYDPDRLVNHFVESEQIADTLDRTLDSVLPQARPVAQVLPSIARQAGFNAWIDWSQTGELGLGPQTTALVVTSARPLRRALHDFATQFSLVVAIEDKSSLWITSPKAYRQQPRYYVIPSQNLTREQWRQRLRPLTPVAVDGSVGEVVVILTPDSKFIFARCCRPTVEM